MLARNRHSAGEDRPSQAPASSLVEASYPLGALIPGCAFEAEQIEYLLVVAKLIKEGAPVRLAEEDGEGGLANPDATGEAARLPPEALLSSLAKGQFLLEQTKLSNFSSTNKDGQTRAWPW